MLAVVKQKWKEKVEERFTIGQRAVLILLVILYFDLVLFSAIPGLSGIVTRAIVAQRKQKALARVIQSMCQRALWVSTAGGIGLGAFLLGQLKCGFVSAAKTRIYEWQTGLLEKASQHRYRSVVVRHFLILHNVDLFTLGWAAVFAMQFFLCLHGGAVVAWLLLALPLLLLGIQMQGETGQATRWYTKLGNLALSVFLLLCQVLLLRQFDMLRELYEKKDMRLAVLQFLLMVFAGLTVQAVVQAFWSTEERVDRRARTVLHTVVLTVALYLLLDVLLKSLINEYDLSQVIAYITTDMLSALNGVNLFLAILFVLAVTAISGASLGSTLLLAVYSILLVGNVIKIKFHASLLQPADLFSLKELFLIMPNYIGRAGVVGLAIAGICAFAVIVFKIRQIGHFLMPRPSIAASLLIIPIFIYGCMQTNSGEYGEVVSGQYGYYPEYINYQIQGPFIYNFTNIYNLKDIFPSKPKGYSLKMVEAEKQKFPVMDTVDEVVDEKPDVILIMAESLFDLSQLSSVSFNENPVQTVSQYRVGSIVSPWYGGGTACVEFEGITGFSNLFFVHNLCAYTTYLNDSGLRIPSIATAFAEAGYDTTAVHLNDGNFYNRNKAYSILGFDQFYSISDYAFGESERNHDGLVKDENFFSVIRTELENEDAPQFIFGVSIEGHGPYEEKYVETDVRVTSENISDTSKHSLEQYAQAVKNFDDDLSEFISYLAERDRPTLVYVWGDHLPNLEVFDELEYFNDGIYNQYETPFVAYSNYKTITVDTAYMTPNQITPQILKDAGIPHASYYDYIYSLREDYPILHHQYTAGLDSERLQDYWLIQYDLMFGKQYLLQSEEGESGE